MRPIVLIAVPVILAVTTVGLRAHAGDPVLAQAMFDEGKRLMAAGRAPEACGKFAESERLDPGIGTLFHLAECYERTGKTALAWTTYLEVASEAKAQGQTARVTVAHDRAAALEGKLARVTIDPGPERNATGLEIVRDGAPVAPAEWGVALPVDPGPHEVVVRARAKGSWRTSVEAVPGGTTSVVVPVLPDAPSEPAAPASAPSPQPPVPAPRVTTTAAEIQTGESRGTGQRAAGIAIGIVGLAGLGVGSYYGLTSLRDHNDAQAHCGSGGCDATGVSLRDDARRTGDVATVALAVGGGLLAVGLIVLGTAPRSHAPIVAVGPGGVSVAGRF